MKIGVKYCGGCNPRYERGKALEVIKNQFIDGVSFDHAKEDMTYDVLLVIGGCTNCCASYEEYKANMGVVKMWDEGHIEEMISIIADYRRREHGQ